MPQEINGMKASDLLSQVIAAGSSAWTLGKWIDTNNVAQTFTFSDLQGSGGLQGNAGHSVKVPRFGCLLVPPGKHNTGMKNVNGLQRTRTQTPMEAERPVPEIPVKSAYQPRSNFLTSTGALCGISGI